ncbi:MAG TPA: NAD(P) transhydrogenase subunit alpha [Salinimicrobium sp.]|nr:NAD(P) transhydrogenase subunit alpha [Salinimicrobium sp.]
MKTLGILKEPNQEKRVCLLPSEVKRLTNELEVEVKFESGLGEKIGISDEAYVEAGAISDDQTEILLSSDIICTIHHNYHGQKIKEGLCFVGIFNLLYYPNRLEKYTQNKADIFSLDLLPRSTTAQSMDVLSSMGSLSGYKAVIKAAELFGGSMPMFTTAAGTLRPAKVLVIGAGVAGLQAIATAKRLGAVVEAFDVRSSAGEDIRSLGAKFIEVPGYKESENAGGYAVVQSPEYLKKQKELINHHISLASIVIGTANIPGKKAPLLIEKSAVDNMKSGSVIIDLAAEQGGNCELTVNGELIDYNGIKIYGNSHLSRELPESASQLLSNNYFSFLSHLLKNDLENSPLLKGCKVLEKGNIVHPSFESKLETT